MSLEEMKKTNKCFLTPRDVASVIGCSPYSINIQAAKDASMLGFPICKMGTRVRIPRVAFIRWMEGIQTVSCSDDN